MNGTCSHCKLPGTVWRYRIWTVGLRFMDRVCADRLAAMGLCIEAVTTADPREEDLGPAARHNMSTDRVRAGIRWLRHMAATA